MKKIAAATAPGPNTEAIKDGAKNIPRVGPSRWSSVGTTKDAAPIRRTFLTVTKLYYSLH